MTPPGRDDDTPANDDYVDLAASARRQRKSLRRLCALIVQSLRLSWSADHRAFSSRHPFSSSAPSSSPLRCWSSRWCWTPNLQQTLGNSLILETLKLESLARRDCCASCLRVPSRSPRTPCAVCHRFRPTHQSSHRPCCRQHAPRHARPRAHSSRREACGYRRAAVVDADIKRDAISRRRSLPQVLVVLY